MCGDSEKQHADKRRETESALMERLRRRPDRRVFKLSKGKKTEIETLRQPTAESERSCPLGHSEFNLCSVGSSDFVRLNPGPYLSTLSLGRYEGKGEGKAAAAGGFADNDS